MAALLLILAMLYSVSSASAAQQGQKHQRYEKDVKSEIGNRQGYPSEVLYETVLTAENIDRRVRDFTPFVTNQDAYAALGNKQVQPDGGNLFSSIESELGEPKTKSEKPKPKSAKDAKRVTLKPTTNPVLSPTPTPVLTPTSNPVLSPTSNPVLTPTSNPVLTVKPTKAVQTPQPTERVLTAIPLPPTDTPLSPVPTLF